MKRISHEVEKHGVDNIKVKALFRDRFKRPVNLKIETFRGPEGSPPTEKEVFQGDPMEVNGILAGFAEIAWENGWRPRGLDIVVGMVVKQYKLPPEEL